MPQHEVPEKLDATAARTAIADGRLTPEALAEGCLARIAAREPEVQAWAFIDAQMVRYEAAALDGRSSQAPLFGLPVGVKDIFDTADMPTENGTALHAGRRPACDAAVVERLRAAGAFVMGKTVTTEFAAFTPGETRHPMDQRRTPGGSSSGSAAAVAAGMVPLAIGSQTNGSVIRPASYCGVYGCKPSFGLISRRGMTAQAPSVDHVGFFARSLRDLAMLLAVLAGPDPADPATLASPEDLLPRQSAGDAPAPRLAFVRCPSWKAAEPETKRALEGLASRLAIPAIALPDGFETALEVHRRIAWSEIAQQFTAEFDLGPGALSDGLRALVEGGRAIPAPDYLAAIAQRRLLLAEIAGLFTDFDALLTPAAAGEAPLGLASTGSPIFCTPWTLLGTPTLSLPLLEGPNDLPIGVQLIGAPGNDQALFDTAAWLERRLAEA